MVWNGHGRSINHRSKYKWFPPSMCIFFLYQRYEELNSTFSYTREREKNVPKCVLLHDFYHPPILQQIIVFQFFFSPRDSFFVVVVFFFLLFFSFWCCRCCRCCTPSWPFFFHTVNHINIYFYGLWVHRSTWWWHISNSSNSQQNSFGNDGKNEWITETWLHQAGKEKNGENEWTKKNVNHLKWNGSIWTWEKYHWVFRLISAVFCQC